MPALDALEHVDAPLEETEKRACLGKSKTAEEAHIRVGAVQVCGFGVPRPTSN